MTIELHLTVDGKASCGKAGGSVPPSMYREVTCAECIDTNTYHFARSSEFVRQYGVDTIKNNHDSETAPEVLIERFNVAHPDLILALKGGRVTLKSNETCDAEPIVNPEWKW
jgi:hypothetical protein